MNDVLITEMQTYARSLSALGLTKSGGCVAARADNAHVLIGAHGTEFGMLAPEDVNQYGIHETGEYADILKIFAARSDLFGLFLLDSPFSKAVSNARSTMRASLDDTAQIAGGRIRTAASKKASDALKGLAKNFGCFVKGYGQLTIGRSLHEAYVAALVLEKGARAETQGKPFGGARPLSLFDCLLMRRIYLKKYSQIQEQRL